MRSARASRSIRMIAFSNLRRQKTQSALIGITIAIAVFLAAVSISLLSNMAKPYQDMFERQKGSHINYFLSRNFYDVPALAEWWRSRPGTEDCAVIPCVEIWQGFASVSGRSSERQAVSAALYIAERDPGMKSDLLEMVEGKEKDAPGQGEAWLPNSFANAHKIAVGDKLEIPVENGVANFTVSGIVIDPIFSNTAFANPCRIWVSPGELGFHFKPENLRSSILSVRLSSPALEAGGINAFNERLGGIVNGYTYKYSELLLTFRAFFAILSAALIGFSVLTLLIAAFSIYNVVSGSIGADYRRIGILKSLGFRPPDIVAGYGAQFLIISLVAVPLALIGAFFAGSFLQRVLFISVSPGGAAEFPLGRGILLLIVFPLMITAIAILFSRRAGRIKAVEAIRLGESEGAALIKSAMRLRAAKTLPLTAVLALRQLSRRKRRSVANGVTIVLASFLLVFGVDFATCFAKEGITPAFWGYDAGEVSVNRPKFSRISVERDRLWAELARDERVQGVFPEASQTLGVPSIAGRPADLIYGIVIDGDMDAAGLRNIAGRNPRDSGEISLATNSMKRYGKKIGDAIDVVIAGKRLSFAIVGSFQWINNMGSGFRLLKEGYARGDPGATLDYASVILRDPSRRKEYIESVEAAYGEAVDAKDLLEVVSSTLSQVINGALAIISAFALIILAASFAVINANVAMEIDENRRVFGVYKTLGMAPRQIRRIVCLKSMAVGLVSGIAGCIAALAFQGPLMTALLSILGYRHFDMPFSVPAAISATAVLCLFSGFSAWLPSRSVKKLNVRELIVE